jgi:hypothetical protein
MVLICTAAAAGAQPAPEEAWQVLFNGRDLTGWIPKIRGHAPGDDPDRTFRVESGLLTVAYDNYSDFAERFGHLFYTVPYSHYRLRVEYRFVGEAAANTPEWAVRNSGAMLHAQAPDSMTVAQDFPISIEFQFLGGLGDGGARPTGSLCSPGTHVVYRGELAATHCIESSAPTFDGDQWVLAEALVLGSERVVHYINATEVIEYGGITYGGGVVSGHRPELKPDGEPLTSGYISLQSEGHPVQFRRVELLDLVGCMDDTARNYRRYFVAHDAARCEF